MKTEFLVRVEAQNLGNFILDSDDLSTVRGGGLLILLTHHLLCGSPVLGDLDKSPADLDFETNGPGIPRFFETEDPQGITVYRELQDKSKLKLDCISNGASIIIYRTELEGDSDAAAGKMQEFCQELRDYFAAPQFALNQATFAVGFSPITSSFSETMQQLGASIHRMQMRYGNVLSGPLNTDQSIKHFCSIDKIRAATEDLAVEDKSKDSARVTSSRKHMVSLATRIRRKFGRSSKLRLYSMLGSGDTPELLRTFNPVWDFQQLTTAGPAINKGGSDCLNAQLLSDVPANLIGKMAVIYIDGNRFGKAIQRNTTCAGDYKKCDDYIQQERQLLLKNLALWASDTSSMQTWLKYDSEFHVGEMEIIEGDWVKAHRIETLLWGGDEMIWVVPAWHGLQVIDKFFEWTGAWKLKSDDRETQLTHAVGAVFCSHKSPIRGVVNLAKRLADSVKSNLGKIGNSRNQAVEINKNSPYSRDVNAVAIQVLESFDHLGEGENFDSARQKQRLPQLRETDMILTASELKQLLSQMLQLRDLPLPRSRLFTILAALRADGEVLEQKAGVKDQGSRFIAAVDRAVELTPGEKERTRKLLMKSALENTIDSTATWQWAAELWDYYGQMGTYKE